LYSERYRTLGSCFSTSILPRETGGRVMYWARASRVREEPAGPPAGLCPAAGYEIFTDMTADPTIYGNLKRTCRKSSGSWQDPS
jgi:hypothetical protein